MSNFVLFYGHTNGKQHACFSNWYHAPFEKDGVRFENTEQYLMYRKALLMGDTEEWGVYKGNPAVLVKKIDGSKIIENAKKLGYEF